VHITGIFLVEFSNDVNHRLAQPELYRAPKSLTRPTSFDNKITKGYQVKIIIARGYQDKKRLIASGYKEGRNQK